MSTDLATRYEDDDASPRTGGEDLRQGIPISFNGKDGSWYRDGGTKLPVGSQFLLIGFSGSYLKWEEIDGKRQVERRNLSDDELVSRARMRRPANRVALRMVCASSPRHDWLHAAVPRQNSRLCSDGRRRARKLRRVSRRRRTRRKSSKGEQQWANLEKRLPKNGISN